MNFKISKRKLIAIIADSAHNMKSSISNLEVPHNACVAHNEILDEESKLSYPILFCKTRWGSFVLAVVENSLSSKYKIIYDEWIIAEDVTNILNPFCELITYYL
jgi:GTP-sensing pleiotropic transcriptional regulator CodY